MRKCSDMRSTISFNKFIFFQIPVIIAQMGAVLPKSRQEIRMTTAAGTVIQLMGSDEQYDLPSFPIVLA